MNATIRANTRPYPGRLAGVLAGLAATLLLLGLPLIGVAIVREPISVYLEFPPLTRHVHHVAFSWIAFCILAAGIIAALLPFVVRLLRSASSDSDTTGKESPCVTPRSVEPESTGRTQGPALHRTQGALPIHTVTSHCTSWSGIGNDSGRNAHAFRSKDARKYGVVYSSGAAGACNEDGRSAFRVPHFPLWGWAALVFGIAAWILAWTCFAWFEPFQRFTFSPLWFAYIGVVNALTFRRTGQCLLMSRPRYMVGLFIASAAFWWYFEYLNRFVQNWYYVNCDGLTPLQYFVFATLPFSTVLPAVMSTAELLGSFRRFAAPFTDFMPMAPTHPRVAAAMVLAIAAAGLALLAVWPSYLFPLLWLSPLLVLTSLDTLLGRPTILDSVRRGDWSRIVTMAVAALICGFFWEMWNFWSLARWKYSVPLVQAFHIFEMPILGYAGYLPFGLECAIIADRVAGWVGKRTNPSDPSDQSDPLEPQPRPATGRTGKEEQP